MRLTTWTEDTPTLLQISQDRGVSIHREERSYRLIPTLLTDFGQRIFRGIPWLEHYRVESELFHLQYETQVNQNDVPDTENPEN